MPEQALLDNDVALKVACYSLTDEALAVTTISDLPPGILGVGVYVLRGYLRKDDKVADVDRARAALERLFASVHLLEPNAEEVAIAAELEAEANRRDLELDVGESQLLAMLAKRSFSVLITGDKRAIRAMAMIAAGFAANRIACLEQLIAKIVDLVGVEAVRSHVCAEQRVDRAITACFACGSDAVGRADVAAGLLSYIRHLDGSAPGMLMHAFVNVSARHAE